MALLLAFAQLPAAAERPGCTVLCGSRGNVGTYDHGLSVDLQHRTSSWRPGIQGSSSPQGSVGPLVEYHYEPVCDGACHSATAQTTANTANCTGTATAVWVSTRVVGSTAGWTLQGPPECLTPAEQLPYDPGQIQAAVDDYFQHIPLPEPGLTVAPADNAVVNLPEIVSADVPPQTSFTVDIAPFPTVTITTNVQWEWNFGDGTWLTTSTPGHAYDPTDTDLSHYVTHTYLKPNAAWPLSVTSIWSGTYTVAGLPGTQPVDGTVQRTTTHPLAAAEYAGTLTGN
jgi:hypothetical protein